MTMRPIPRFTPTLRVRDLLRALIERTHDDPVAAFSQAFARFIGVRHAIPAPSARGGLTALVRALDLPRDGEVLLPALTFHCVPAVFHRAGLRVRFVDIEETTYCMDPERLERAMGPQTVAVVPVHLYGRACDMGRILAVARAHGLPVIEDCAQACGAWFGGRRVGSLGTAGVFSFHAAKNLAALNFGMVTTDSDELAGRVREHLCVVRQVGAWEVARRVAFAAAADLVTRPLTWRVVMAPGLRLAAHVGFDPIEAATSERATGDPGDLGRAPVGLQGRVALRVLQRVDEDSARRWANGERLRHCLDGTPGIGLPAPSREGENIYLSFVARVEDRRGFRRRLLERGVDTHPGNMAVGPLIPGLGGLGECAVAADVARRLVHLPVHTGLEPDDMERVAEAVRAALRR